MKKKKINELIKRNKEWKSTLKKERKKEGKKERKKERKKDIMSLW